MKSILLIALFMIISCETTEASNDAISFYECLLLKSDTVFNHISSLIDSIQTLDPIKFAASFTTIYPAIAVEVTRCSIQVKNNVEDDEIVLKSDKNDNIASTDSFKVLLNAVIKYVMSFLNSVGINLNKMYNEAFLKDFLNELLK